MAKRVIWMDDIRDPHLNDHPGVQEAIKRCFEKLGKRYELTQRRFRPGPSLLERLEARLRRRKPPC